MTVTGVFYIVITIITFYMGGAYRNLPLMSAAVALMLFFAVILVLNIIQTVRFSVSSIRDLSGEAGEKITAGFIFSNSTPFPSSKAVFFLEAGYEGFARSFRKSKKTVPFGCGKNNVNFEITALHSGRIVITVRAVKIYAVIPFFGIKKKINRTIMLNFFPEEKTDIADEVSGTEVRLDDFSEFPVYGRGTDVNEVNEIREYREGDSLRRVHWNLTARTGRVFIREPGKETETAADIYLTEKSRRKPRTDKETEAALMERDGFYADVCEETMNLIGRSDVVRVHMEEDVFEIRDPEEMPFLMEKVFDTGVTDFADNALMP